MAGHGNSRPRRDAARTERWHLRYETYEAEKDPAARLAVAYDWLRSELAHLARSKVPGARGEADSLMLYAAADLAHRARQANARSDAQ
jgi:hypothetical protein